MQRVRRIPDGREAWWRPWRAVAHAVEPLAVTGSVRRPARKQRQTERGGHSASPLRYVHRPNPSNSRAGPTTDNSEGPIADLI